MRKNQKILSKRIFSGIMAGMVLFSTVAPAIERFDIGMESVYANEVSENGTWEYVVLEDGTAEITGYRDEVGENRLPQHLVIPGEIDGYKVREVGGFGYDDYYGQYGVGYDKKNLESVVISEGITSVEDGIFCDCENLKSVLFPESLKKIGERIFQNTALETIILPNGLNSIGKSAFNGCESLKRVDFSNSLISIGEFAFDGCNNLKEVKIPESVVEIGNYAFRSCSELDAVDIPEGVTSIGEHSFDNCIGLKSVFLPKSLLSLGSFAFQKCSQLESIVIPNGVTKLIATFRDCTSLKVAIIPESVEYMSLTFSGCTSLEKVVFPHDYLMNVKQDTFENCPSTMEIVSLEEIEEKFVVELSLNEYVYDGTEKQPVVTVKSEETILTEGIDYTVEYLNNVEVGRASVCVHGIGNYYGAEWQVLFCIISPESVETITQEVTSGQDTTGELTTEQLTTEELTTEQPTTEEPTTEEPTTEQPTTEEPTTEEPTTEQPTTEQPTTEESTSEQLTTEQATTEELTTEQPTTEQPTTEEPITEESTSEQLTTEEPITEQPTTEELTTEQPSSEESTTEQPSEEATEKPTEPTKIKVSSMSLASTNYTYNGYAKKPTPTVYAGTKKLKVSKDYIITYKNNVNPGTATVTIKGIGDYTGTISKAFKINLQRVTNFKQNTNYSSSKIIMTWSKVKGATGYAVYRANSKNGTYKYLKTVLTNSCTNAGLKAGSKYYYKVRAYVTANGKKIYGEYSEAKSMLTKPAAPSNLAVTLKSRTAKISWSKVNAVQGYEIYMSNSRTGTYQTINTVGASTTAYNKTGLVKGKKYYFKMRAYTETGTGAKVYSGYSKIKVVTVK